jgi:hypothetical protein
MRLSYLYCLLLTEVKQSFDFYFNTAVPLFELQFVGKKKLIQGHTIQDRAMTLCFQVFSVCFFMDPRCNISLVAEKKTSDVSRHYRQRRKNYSLFPVLSGSSTTLMVSSWFSLLGPFEGKSNCHYHTI